MSNILLDKYPFPLKTGEWDDLRFPVTTLRINPANTNPDFNYTEVGYNFNDNQDGVLYCIAQLPHAWKEGSEIHPHIHWLQTHSGTPNWVLSYRIEPNGGSPTEWDDLTIIGDISATKIRRLISANDPSWKRLVANGTEDLIKGLLGE